MSQRLRTILFIGFLACFFTITPLVMLYAAGYKFNSENRSIQKTGMLDIETSPKGALIHIDGKLQEKISLAALVRKPEAITTPAKIKNLLPGEYLLKISSEGYWDWERKVNIYPGQALNFEDIALVRKEMPMAVTGSGLAEALLSPGHNKYLFNIEGGQQIFDIENESTTTLNNKPGEVLAWSEGADKAIIGSRVYSLSNGSSAGLPVGIPDNSLHLKFDQNDNSVLYYISGRSIYRIGLNGKSAEKIVDNASDDFIARGDEIMYISRTDNKVYLNFYSLALDNNSRKIELPFSQKYEFIESRKNLISLMDRERMALYIIDKNSFSPIILSLNDVSKVDWINDNSFLYSNDFEIWGVDLNNRSKWLFTRLSQPITEALWHPDGKFIIFTSENTLNILDIDGPEKKTTELIRMDSVKSPTLGAQGESVYFFGTVGGQKALYKLRLR